MNIFQMKTQPHGIERINEFINDGFVCIGYPGIGNLNGVEKDEIRKRLHNRYKWTGSQLGVHLGNINAFVNTMKKNDVVLISEGEWVHIGKLDVYDYVKNLDNDIEAKCHRRDVQWITKVQKHQLNEYVKELLRNRSIVTKFKHPVDIAELDKLLVIDKSLKTGDSSKKKILINEETTRKAIDILMSALDSDNEAIRVEAAKSLLKINNIID